MYKTLFDMLPKELIIYHILPLLKPKTLNEFSKVSEYLNNILIDKNTYKILLYINFEKIPNEFKKYNNKSCYNRLYNSKIIKVYKYDEYLFDVPMTKTSEGESTTLSVVKYLTNEYPDYIPIIPKHKINSKIFKPKTISSYTTDTSMKRIKGTDKHYLIMFDQLRDSIHLVLPDKSFVIKTYKLEKDFNNYKSPHNTICYYNYKAKKMTKVSAISEDSIKELINNGYYI